MTRRKSDLEILIDAMPMLQTCGVNRVKVCGGTIEIEFFVEHDPELVAKLRRDMRVTLTKKLTEEKKSDSSISEGTVVAVQQKANLEGTDSDSGGDNEPAGEGAATNLDLAHIDDL